MKSTKDTVIFLILCLGLSPFAGADGQQSPESDRIKTLVSLQKLDDFPLYSMPLADRNRGQAILC